MSEPAVGSLIDSYFLDFSTNGYLCVPVQARGRLLAYQNGYAMVRYRSEDLPARLRRPSEFVVVPHESLG